MWSLIAHRFVSTIKPNLPIWWKYLNLKGIMVNKSRIHKEIWYFWEIFWNLIKSDDELRWEIRENGRFKKITQRQIHGIKNHSIWISIRGESKTKVERNFWKSDHEITKINDKIKLNYDPKLQINDTSRKIRGKTRILTRDSDRNYPINRRIEAFHSSISKTSINVQEMNSP